MCAINDVHILFLESQYLILGFALLAINYNNSFIWILFDMFDSEFSILFLFFTCLKSS